MEITLSHMKELSTEILNSVLFTFPITHPMCVETNEGGGGRLDTKLAFRASWRALEETVTINKLTKGPSK